MYDNKLNIEDVRDWGMEYEVITSYEKYLNEGLSDQDAWIQALDDWDLL